MTSNSNSHTWNSLPSLSNRHENGIPLYYLTDTDKEQIAIHLDTDSAWKFVAEAIPIEPKEINWISDRETPRGSKTLLLFSDLVKQGLTLEHFMKAVNISNYKVMPVIDYLDARYPEIVKKYEEDSRRTFLNICQNPRNRTQSEPTSPETENGYKTDVLVAYHDKDLNQMYNMTNCLQKNDFKVYVDNNQNSFAPATERLKEIQKIFTKAKCTLILISPAFLQEINLARTVEASNPNLISHHVVNLAKDVVMKKSRKMEHLVVALIDNASRDDTPRWMRSIKMYKWPDEFKNLFCAIIDPNHLIAKLSSGRGGCRSHGCQSRCPRHGK